MFPKALTLTISSVMAIYLDKYHNTLIGRGEKRCAERKREEREKEKKGEQKKEKEE